MPVKPAIKLKRRGLVLAEKRKRLLKGKNIYEQLIDGDIKPFTSQEINRSRPPIRRGR